jgi:hypothetical protein
MQIIYQFCNGNCIPSDWQSLHTFTLKIVPTCTGTKDSLLDYGLLYMNSVSKWIVIAYVALISQFLEALPQNFVLPDQMYE